jgi:hypothetical protein
LASEKINMNMKNKNEIVRRTVQGSLLSFIALASTEVVLMKGTGRLEAMFLPTVMFIACLFAIVTIWSQVQSLLPIKRQRMYNDGPFSSLRRK